MPASVPRRLDLPPLTYLSTDSIGQTVGASQVLPYVEGLSRAGLAVTLHSLEKTPPAPAVTRRLEQAGVRWIPHAWGGGGPAAGLTRMLRGASWLRHAALVHARSDIPAGSALLARCPAWVWDMRGLWADERIELGLLRAGSPQERLMRWIEHRAAHQSGAIITLAATAVDVLGDRHGSQVREKAHVITTCVDLDRFLPSSMPPGPPLRLLLAGTLSRRYDVPLMLRLIEVLRRRRATEVVALVPEPSPWEARLRQAGVDCTAASSSAMPTHVAAGHVGLSVLRADGGVSLRASVPTKIGEFLAAGRPVVVNAGLGDLDRWLGDHDCGVVIAGVDELSLEQAANDLERLVEDPGTPARCRGLAEAHFDLRNATATLLEVYRQAAAGGRRR